MKKRKSISRTVRFEVFKRDGFTCSYCGRTPPAVTLEIDHIEPYSKGGNDDLHNLLTACFDCNRGKRNIPLDKAPGKLSENMEVLKEKEEQLKEYRKLVKLIHRRRMREMAEVEQLYTSHYKKWTFSDDFKRVSLSRFFDLLPLDRILEAMRISISRFPSDENRVIRYFCGICWNMIRREREGKHEV